VCDRASIRSPANVDQVGAAVPDERTILRFRHRFEIQMLQRQSVAERALREEQHLFCA